MMTLALDEVLMKFETWTPPALIDYYHAEYRSIEARYEKDSKRYPVEDHKKLRENLEREKSEEDDLISKLGNHPDMRSAWKELRKRTKRSEWTWESLQGDTYKCELHMIIDLIGSIQFANVVSRRRHAGRREEVEALPRYCSYGGSYAKADM
jgi:hypothetical protein